MGLQVTREIFMQFGCSPRITCASSYEIRSNNDIGLDQGTALPVGLGYHCGIGYGRVLDQAVLDLARTDAVACGLEHVVGPALVPEVAFGVAHRQVAGAAPVTGVLGTGGLLVLPVAQKENRVRLAVGAKAVQRHVTGHAHLAFLAVLVNHCHAVAGVAHAHAAGFGGPQRIAVAHDVVDLGLAKHLVGLDAQLLLTVAKHRVTHRLACAHDGLQLELELRADGARGGAGVGLHHGLECRREQEGVRHTAIAHQFECRLRAETSVEGHDGAAKVQRGQECVHQPAGPGPVRG